MKVWNCTHRVGKVGQVWHRHRCKNSPLRWNLNVFFETQTWCPSGPGLWDLEIFNIRVLLLQPWYKEATAIRYTRYFHHYTAMGINIEKLEAGVLNKEPSWTRWYTRHILTITNPLVCNYWATQHSFLGHERKTIMTPTLGRCHRLYISLLYWQLRYPEVSTCQVFTTSFTIWSKSKILSNSSMVFNKPVERFYPVYTKLFCGNGVQLGHTNCVTLTLY